MCLCVVRRHIVRYYSMGQMALADSSAVVSLQDWVDFDWFSLRDADELLQHYQMLARATNRVGLTAAWLVGAMVDIPRLRDRFRIKTMKDLAQFLHVSETTLNRYRAVNQLLTPAMLRKLADNGVSVNAVKLIVDTSKGNAQQARAVLDALVNGDIVTVKQCNAMLADALVSKCGQAAAMLPMAESCDVVDEREELLTPEVVDDGKTPAEKLMEAERKESSSDASDEDDDEDRGSTATQEDSQNKRDIMLLFRTVKTTMTPLRRNIHDVTDNIVEQLQKLYDKENVLFGDPDVTVEYTDLVDAVAQDVQLMVERALEACVELRNRGYIHRKLSVPEGETIDTIFSAES